MPVEMTLWQVDGTSLQEVTPVHLATEERLETWLFNDISALRMDLALVGRQIVTGYRGRIDLLALDVEAARAG